ncbi:MAG TPA: hypothetical protein VNO32_08505 [Candidatus Acidoferrum sp.]|nr:hypothetical protein [Candidatus Acidoferrum sp.]
MLWTRIPRLGFALFALAFATSLFAHGQFWDFLGYTQVNRSQDHGRIQINRRDRLFRNIQLRVSGEAIFLDRLVVHFANGTSQEFIVSGRISPEGRNYLIALSGEPAALESVELWYYKEPWAHNPGISLYGTSLPDADGESIAREN